MKNKSFSFVFAALVLAVVSLPNLLRADAPPPPPFTVYVNYEGQKVTDQKYSATTLVCRKDKSAPDASLPTQLLISQDDSANGCVWQPGSPAEFCSLDQCHFRWAMGKFKIAVYLPSVNKTFISNELNREYLGHYGFQTTRYYKLDLAKDGSAKLSESFQKEPDIGIGGDIAPPVNPPVNPPTPISPFYISTFVFTIIGSLLITLILELIVALIFKAIKKAPKRILLGVLIGNVISVPLLWILVSRFYSMLYPAEIIVVVFEAWLIKYFSQGKLSWQACLLLSLIMNLVSFIFGPVLYNYMLFQ